MIPHTSVPLLDVEVSPMTATEVARAISSPAPSVRLILNHNLHSVHHYWTNDDFRRLYSNAWATLIDGWPIYALLRSRGPVPRATRIGSTDWIETLSQGESKLRIYVLGGEANANSEAVKVLASRMPQATVAGRDGFFSLEHEGADVVRELSAFEPNLVLVGMGMPRQEQFIQDHMSQLPPAYYATVGGAIHYIAGDVALSPRWVGGVGLEWLWRLAHEPRRLAHRYLVEPFALLLALRHRPRPEKTS